jgi:hypothetical protein
MWINLLMNSRVETDEVLDYAIISLVLSGSPPSCIGKAPGDIVTDDVVLT